MKIIIELPEDEAYREIEDEEENIMAAYRKLVREIENICTVWQVRYTEIDIIFGERK